MINLKRKAIVKKISINPFSPSLYKVDYNDDLGYDIQSDEYKIADFYKPVRVYDNEKLEKLETSDTMLEVKMNQYVISEYDCVLEKGMRFDYFGKRFEITRVEQKIKYGEIFAYIGELKCL